MPTPKKKEPLDNYQKFQRALEINSLNLPEMAEITGYSVNTLYGLSMPDRTSTRAREVTDRFLEFMNMRLLAKGLKTV